MSCYTTGACHTGCACYNAKVTHLVRTVKKYLTVPPKTNVEATQDIDNIINALKPLEEGEAMLAEMTVAYGELKKAVDAVSPSELHDCDECMLDVCTSFGVEDQCELRRKKK
jgi:hypothetical protein